MEKNFTERSRETLTEAQGQALDRRHMTVEPEHLLVSLLNESDGFAASILQHIGVDTSALTITVEQTLAEFPTHYF